jgi:hypothetical protein
MRFFLDELEKVSVYSIGSGYSAFKYVTKYHENHSFNNCRLIKFNENYSNEYWRDLLKKIGLNLLCVAAHYSNRYKDSDNFVLSNSDDELASYTFTLKNTSQNELIDKFMDSYIQKTSNDFSIEWKNLHFIWKQFLSSNNLPNVVFSNNLKLYFKTKFQFDETSDSFIGITSKHLPVYKDFIQFWNTTIHTSISSDFEDELEIDEISSLFKLWNKSKNILSEENIIRILKC